MWRRHLLSGRQVKQLDFSKSKTNHLTPNNMGYCEETPGEALGVELAKQQAAVAGKGKH